MNLYIYKYNNYYNRMVKSEETLAAYGEPVHALYSCKDFSPNDGVNTVHIFGSAANNYDGSGDYLIVTDETDNIISRWFIIEINFARNGQWNLTLRRDLVVDYYDAIVNAPCFIEKANLPANSPFVFNSENITVNQIKNREVLLKDETGCPWIIGYYDKTKRSEINGTTISNTIFNAKQISTSIENWEYYQYSNLAGGGQLFLTDPYDIVYDISGSNLQGRDGYVQIRHPGTFSYGDVYFLNNNSSIDFGGVSATSRLGPALAAGIASQADNLYRDLIITESLKTQDEFNVFNEFNGLTIVDTNGAYYKIKIIEENSVYKEIDYPSGSLLVDLQNAIKDISFISGQSNDDTFEVYYNAKAYSIELEELENMETQYSLGGADKLNTTDAPWNIFAIPYGVVRIENEVGEVLLRTNKELSLNTAMSMQAQNPGLIYDIQILPYCPIQSLITFGQEITVTNESQYSFITSPNPDNAEERINTGIIFHVENARFTFNIAYEIPSAKTAIERKFNNECTKYRLASPNYSNYFDFSVEKNGGLNYFNIDCEYKPYLPYIHVNPNFGNLYGRDFNDPRGLVLGGDFSISQIINQWEQYQVQNKNFQEIFNRQIQNMEVQQDVARTQERWQAVAGAISGAASGAFVGSLTSISGATLGGGLIGGAASMVGAILDRQMNELLRTEALDYTKDMFGYQLGNVQALPQTISKVSAFNNNNKLFPVLEIYKCTSSEAEAFVQKIAYNGMTVGIIDKINNYLGNTWEFKLIQSKNYIKGQLIRLEDIGDDFHLLKEISNEINKGVYF